MFHYEPQIISKRKKIKLIYNFSIDEKDKSECFKPIPVINWPFDEITKSLKPIFI